MRIAAFILSLIITVLSFVPCADANRFSESSTQSISQNRNHSHSQNDECTPFCICACCQATYFQVHTDPVAASIEHLAVPEYSSYLLSPTIEITSAIWQPPRA